MRPVDREKIITAAIGLVIGVSAATIFFFGRQLLPQTKTLSPQIVTPAPTPRPQSTEFNLLMPEDNSITNQNTASVSGTALPGTHILVVANADEKSLTSETSGQFNTRINLEDGENKIIVIYWQSGQEPQSLVRTVTREI